MLTTYKRWVHKQRRNEMQKQIEHSLLRKQNFRWQLQRQSMVFKSSMYLVRRMLVIAYCFIQMQITKKTKKTENVLSANTITGYGNIILLKRKIKIVDGKLQRSKSSIFDAGETIISQKHVKIVEYVRLMFARTHTVICCIKKPRKSRGINPHNPEKQEGESVESSHTSSMAQN